MKTYFITLLLLLGSFLNVANLCSAARASSCAPPAPSPAAPAPAPAAPAPAPAAPAPSPAAPAPIPAAPVPSIAPGGWEEIKNTRDPHVVKIGEFAVLMHNILKGTNLALRQVISGQMQVVEGMNYDLILEVEDGVEVSNYGAFVYERVWEKTLKLVYFDPIILKK